MGKEKIIKDPEQEILNEAIENLKKDSKVGDWLVDLAKEGTTKYEFISSGLKSVDDILGGGFVNGKISEVYGVEEVKTALLLKTIGQAQKDGSRCIYLDCNASLEKEKCEVNEVDTINLSLALPDNIKEVFEITDNAVRSGLFNLVVVDNVDCFDIKSEDTDWHGHYVREMSKGLRVLQGLASENNVSVVFGTSLKQKHENKNNLDFEVNGISNRALKFYSSQRLELDNAESFNKNIFRAVCRKNKVAEPLRRTILNYDPDSWEISEVLQSNTKEKSNKKEKGLELRLEV